MRKSVSNTKNQAFRVRISKIVTSITPFEIKFCLLGSLFSHYWACLEAEYMIPSIDMQKSASNTKKC